MNASGDCLGAIAAISSANNSACASTCAANSSIVTRHTPALFGSAFSVAKGAESSAAGARPSQQVRR